MVIMTLTVFEWEIARGSSLELARTAAVNMLVTSHLFYLFQARHFTRSAFHLETITGNPGIATTKIAFVGTASGPKEIYFADYS